MKFRNQIIKPVGCLTRKHVFPTNVKKMNVKRAGDIFSDPGTVLLKYLKHYGGRTEMNAILKMLAPPLNFWSASTSGSR